MANLKSRDKSQQVLFEEGKEKMVEQTVSYDPNDKWVGVSHARHEMTMTLENWRRLNQMVEEVAAQQDEQETES